MLYTKNIMGTQGIGIAVTKRSRYIEIMLRWVVFPWIVLALASCASDTGNAPKLKGLGPKPTRSTPATEQNPPDVPQDLGAESKQECDTVLTKLGLHKDESSKAKIWQVTLESANELDVVDLKKWLADHTEILLSGDCPWDLLAVRGRAPEGLFVEGQFSRQDASDRKAGKISEAEWLRRLSVHLVETIPALKKNFIKARQANDLQSARKWLEKWLAKAPQNISLRIIKGNLLFELKNYFEAIETFESILRETPDQPVALYNLALAKKKIGSFDDSAKLYLRLWKQVEQDGKFTASERDAVLLNLVDAYLSNNQPASAKTFLELIHDTTETGYLLLKANYLRGAGQFQEAKDILTQMVNAESADAAVYFNLVLINLDLKDIGSARDAMKTLRLMDQKMARELAFLQILSESSESKKDGETE